MVIPIAFYCVHTTDRPQNHGDYNELQRRMEGRKLISVQIFIYKVDVPMQRSPTDIDFVERFGPLPASMRKDPEKIHYEHENSRREGQA